MARVLVSTIADGDVEEIFANLDVTGGYKVATAFGAALDALYLQLSAFPHSGSPRPLLGPALRIGIVRPYVIIYRHDAAKDTVDILRVLHGHRNMTPDLLLG